LISTALLLVTLILASLVLLQPASTSRVSAKAGANHGIGFFMGFLKASDYPISPAKSIALRRQPGLQP